MKVEVLSSQEREIVLRLEEADHAFVNALRRTLMMEVPKLAIEDVTIYDNKSALFDEIIAHRLGMLPVPTDLQAYNFKEECTCEGEGCPSCTVLYTLTFEGPGTVFARDLQPLDPEHAIPEPDVPIVKLGRDQRVMLEATAVLGRGGQHAKWQPVVAAGYREVPTVKVKGKVSLDAKVREELQSLAPEGSVTFKSDKIEIHDTVAAHDFLYNVHDRYGIDNVEFGVEDGAFLFHFETDGALSPKAAVREALRLLMEKTKSLEDFLGDLK